MALATTLQLVKQVSLETNWKVFCKLMQGPWKKQKGHNCNIWCKWWKKGFTGWKGLISSAVGLNALIKWSNDQKTNLGLSKRYAYRLWLWYRQISPLHWPHQATLAGSWNAYGTWSHTILISAGAYTNAGIETGPYPKDCERRIREIMYAYRILGADNEVCYIV